MKIINLTLSKSGTTSIEQSLHFLKYKVTIGHWGGIHNQYTMGYVSSMKHNNDYSNKEDNDNFIIDFIKKSPYEVFSDAPFWSKKLFNDYVKYLPDCYYLYIYRDSHDWTTSLFKMLDIDVTNNTDINIVYNRIKNKKKLEEYVCFGFINFIIQELNITKFNFLEIKKYYEDHTQYTINYFNNNKHIKFFHCKINDANINSKINTFLGIKNFSLIHINKTK